MAKRSKIAASENKVIEFVLEELEPVSSAETVKTAPIKPEEPQELAASAHVESSTPVEVEEVTSNVDIEKDSLAFKELELPKLPVLERQDRARLQVQSPNNVYFYWSLRSNPFQTLSRTLGAESASYTLALRLLDTQTEREEIHAVEPEGSYWFNTDAGRTYRAEIGLYSPSRPFIRILFSNTVTTPRKSPSSRAASQSEWRVTSHKFAEVLDVTGFALDAFDVSLAGDDAEEADAWTHAAFAQLLGESEYAREDVALEDVRLAMVALASGRTLEELRWKIGPALFAILQANSERLIPEKAVATLSEYFGIDETEFEGEEYGPAVGASLVQFPRKYYRPYSPLSSSTIGVR